ncbi:MAG: sugar phosphate isomerase/epimerase family protein [Planctomycetota bacterium]|jgi:sugar phosphate isomerase/epimerase
MAQLSVNETTTFRWSFEEDVLSYAEAGVPAIGVWRQKLSDCGLAKAIELLHESGLLVSHLFWAGGFTGSDGRSFRASLEDASEALSTAHALRTDALVVYSGARAGHTFNHARRLIREALKELAPTATELGVVLAVEPMHPGCAGEFTFLTDVDEVLELLEAVGSQQVKIVFDAYHLGHDRRIIDRIPELTPHVALVQLGDGREPPAGEQNRCRLGDGAVPLREIVDALRAAGYDGFFDVELFGEEMETIDYQALLQHAKQAYEDLVGT